MSPSDGVSNPFSAAMSTPPENQAATCHQPMDVVPYANPAAG